MLASLQRRWWIVVACTLGLVVVAGTINTFAIAVFLKPVGQDLGVSRSVLSSGIMLANVLCGLVTPFMGMLADRWGSRRILLPGIPLFSLGIAALAFLQNSLISIYSLFALAGLLGAIQNTVPYTKVISRWFDNERGLALGIALGGVGFGIAVVPQLAQFLIQIAGWRMAYVGLGAIIMLFAFLPVLLLVREPAPGELSIHAGGSGGGEVPGLTAIQVLTGQWRFWVMTVAFFMAAVSVLGTLVHMVAMLTDRGMSTGQAVAVFSTAGLGAILGRIACGLCLDRFHGPLVAACCFMVPAIGIACLATGVAGLVPLLGGALCGLGLGANNTLMAHFASRYFGLKAYGTIFGVMFGAFLIGAGVGPYLNALSHELLHSYDPALIAFSACLVVASLLLVPLGPYPFAPRATTTRPEPVLVEPRAGAVVQAHGRMRALLVLLMLVLALMSTAVNARDGGRFENVPPETRAWVNGLKNKLRVNCCSTADGFRPQQVERDIERSGYRVRIEGHWYDVPDYAVLEDSNRLGFTVVWFSRRKRAPLPPPDDLVIICFMPGAGS